MDIVNDIFEKLAWVTQQLYDMEQKLETMSRYPNVEVRKGIAVYYGFFMEQDGNRSCILNDLYELLSQFQENGNVRMGLDDSQLQEVFSVIVGVAKGAELKLLAEALGKCKTKVDILHDLVATLINEFNREMVPSSYRKTKTKTTVEGSSLIPVPEDEVFDVIDVAIHLYGFSVRTAREIERSLRQRCLLNAHDELPFSNGRYWSSSDSDDDEWKEKGADDSKRWAIFKKLGKKVDLLNRKLYPPEEAKDLDDDSPKSHKVFPGTASFLKSEMMKVTRDWFFQLESVLFGLVHDLYYMISGNETAENIFQEFVAKLRQEVVTNNGKVPIAVFKILHMVENPVVLRIGGVVMRMQTVRNNGNLHERLDLNHVTEVIHNVILGLRPLLVFARSADAASLKQGEFASHEMFLRQHGVELREIEAMMNSAKLGVGRNEVQGKGKGKMPMW